MLNLIIGHRGTGKSHWLNLVKNLYSKKRIKTLFFDLDKEVEKSSGKTVPELFQQGERSFRQWEKKVFLNLISSLPKRTTCFLSVGAGFLFKKDPSWHVIYLHRSSDKSGRVFLNRPRLTLDQKPLEEYQFFYKKRNPYYLKQADEIFFRREHFKNLEDSDLLFLGLKKKSRPYFSLRLNPQDVPKDKERLKLFLRKRLNWGLRFFELNDQTADKSFIQTIRNFVPENKILFASHFSKNFFSIKNKKHWSWDLSLGEPPKGVTILTLHDRNQKDLHNLLKEFSDYKNYHLKLSVEIFNLKELKTAYDWYSEDPKNRSFLPRSKEGKWLWFRQVFGPKMFLHFIKERTMREPRDEILDQPFLSEALPFIKKWKALAGILGDPVQLSATPAEQNDFFCKRYSIPVLSLSLKEEEMNKENLQIFSNLGFVFFAVTSPLKELAFLSANVCDSASQEFQTANTLIFHKGVWRAFNTDEEGLKSLKEQCSKTTVIWGGGGIRPVLKKHLSLAQFYSAQTAKPLSVDALDFPPTTLIWAVGRNRMEQGCLLPPSNWKISKVIDINYTEDSPGLEYALHTGAQYKNGWEFFKRQAKKQREIFSHLKEKK